MEGVEAMVMGQGQGQGLVVGTALARVLGMAMIMGIMGIVGIMGIMGMGMGIMDVDMGIMDTDMGIMDMVMVTGTGTSMVTSMAIATRKEGSVMG